MNKRIISIISAAALLATGCGTSAPSQPAPTETAETTAAQTAAEVTTTSAETTTAAPETTTAAAPNVPEIKPVEGSPMERLSKIQTLKRPTLLGDSFNYEQLSFSPKAEYLTPKSDLSNVYIGAFWLSDDGKAKKMLGENGFVLEEGVREEFFEIYEWNRYMQKANYVTTDAMLHTYNVYFLHLMRSIESKYLAGGIQEVSKNMLASAQEHYDTLKGTEWEEAAKKELAFFAIGCALQDPDTVIPDAVAEAAAEELESINAAEGIAVSPFTGEMEDYSQYKPRGNYDGTEQLRRYFKTMMWYGRMGFISEDETLNRAALLTVLSMDKDIDNWSKIYQVTSFFAGESDDLTYYELLPLIENVYGANVNVADLAGKTEEWELYNAMCAELEPPQISSVPVPDYYSDEEKAEVQKGFRFMGQRFSIDEAVFEQLIYRNVQENEDGSRRMLPDALDFAAAYGSDTAMDILKGQDNTDYPNYWEQMDKAREYVKSFPEESKNANLYSSWLDTIEPLIERKDEAYPPFMRTDAWQRRNLLTFMGSYAELKHATLLYSKQVMAEMGGGGEETYDDRGYVECEPEVFSRLEALVAATAEGLSKYGMIEQTDRDNLMLLSELSGKLKVIAVKELEGELPSDDDFELIRTFGGQLEHFWTAVMDADYPDEMYHLTQDHPPAYIADIATDPNGYCLEVGTADPFEMLVIVQVDGKLKIASGAVFSFYQFEQPISQRMTDKEWRIKMGLLQDDDGNYNWKQQDHVQEPEWYKNYVYRYEYNY